jgi:chromosomal replication initiation ATPase DnaA
MLSNLEKIELMNEIVERYASQHNLTKEQVCERKKTAPIKGDQAHAIRRAAAIAFVDHLNIRLVSIGEVLGGLDHTTILSYRSAHQRQLIKNPEYRELFGDIVQDIYTRIGVSIDPEKHREVNEKNLRSRILRYIYPN